MEGDEHKEVEEEGEEQQQVVALRTAGRSMADILAQPLNSLHHLHYTHKA